MLITLLTLFVGFGFAQEKKIKFRKGTLTICSSQNFQITGYDGDEVIIKSINNKKSNSYVWSTSSASGNRVSGFTTKKSQTLGKLTARTKPGTVYYFKDDNKKKGLKKLGKANENAELGIFFEIEEKDGELIFRDKPSKMVDFIMVRSGKYEVKIPNSIKLDWKTDDCRARKTRNNNYVFYNSDASSLSNFKGEVELKTSMHNIKFVDVTGPVTVNSLGGNFNVEFIKKKPTKLYSIYSNNGSIDITLPKNSSLSLDAVGKSIYSDLDFKILDEKEINDFGHIMQEMKLKLNSGSVKMKLNAGYGNVYLRQGK
tara:strand:- start:86720 stop:87658 length:939 start_codon:yes stop_codon:yes gene_type:complete